MTRLSLTRAGITGLLLLAAAGSPAAAPQSKPEATSLFGKPLVSVPPTGEALKRLEANLAEARKTYEASPSSADALIWLGRRTAYLGRFREAMAIFGEGIAKHPDDARLYRHRGHRYITVREFDNAIADLEKAVSLERGKPDEVEPDGQPNARNVPIGTTQSNIYYHLGLAYYLKGDFQNALRVYREGEKLSTNPDRLVSLGHWLYMTLRRMGRDEEARKVLEPVTATMEVIENGSYHRLMLLYKGELAADELLASAQEGVEVPTVGYGVANWHFYNGRKAQAIELWRRILAGEQWGAFGYLAAEAEMKRLGETP
jgi:tetratricopeptide (TPR) repeat protein